MRLIVITRSDGGVSLMQCHDDADIDREVAEWQRTQNGVNWVSLAEHAIEDYPADRTFRDAWKPDLTVDMDKARIIHMDRIRAARDAELARLDIEQLKGRDVTAEKQRLRDIPQTFDLSKADTPEALKALWPAELPERT